jgi:hypothetical protein
MVSMRRYALRGGIFKNHAQGAGKNVGEGPVVHGRKAKGGKNLPKTALAGG